MSYHYVRRYKVENGIARDMGIVDIPTSDLERTLKQNPNWVDLGEVGAKPEIPIQKEKILECPICGYEAKDDKALKAHKTKAHV